MKKMNGFMEKYRTAFLLLFLACFEICFFAFLNKYMDLMISSDESSELLLGRILSEENQILSANWYYSSELRILSSPLVYALVFKFVHNWHLVRLISLAILHLIMLAGLWFMTNESKIFRLFPLLALLVMIPVSGDYFYIVLWGAHYLPYIAISFLGIGFLFGFEKDSGVGKRSFFLICSCVLAFLACAVGLRQMLILYLPLFFTSIVLLLSLVLGKNIYEGKSIKRISVFSFLSSGFGFAGYLFNKLVLSRYYSFMGWKFQFVDFSLDRFVEVVNGFLHSFGFRTGAVTPKSAVSNVIAGILFLLVVFAILYAIRHSMSISKTYYFMTVFFLSALSLFVLLYGFSDMSYLDRYNLPTLIYVWFLIAMWIEEAEYFQEKSEFVVLALVLGVTCAGLVQYRYQRNAVLLDEERESRVKVADYVLNEGYDYGYSGFWEANVLTEHTDGQVEMQIWFFGEDKINEHQVIDVEPWGQVISHNGYIPEGKVFALFSEKDYFYYDRSDLLPEDHLVFSTDYHRVYGFEDYNEMKQYLVVQ